MRKLLPLLAVVCPWIAHAAPTEGDRTGAPYFQVEDRRAAEAFPLQETRAKVDIAGVIARVRVTQVYANQGSEPIEAVYVFPGSTRAAVFGMEMKIGERTIVAEIAKTADARKKYEAAKENGRAASLLEQERPNVFKMSVANIMPGDRIETRLDYTELLVPEKGVYELVYPTVVGPRYVGESEKSEPSYRDGPPRPSEWTANPHLKSGQAPPYRWALSAKISAGMAVSAVQSPSHRISPRFDARGNAEIETLDEDGGNRDFILRYRLDGDRIETGLMMFRGAKESYFAAMIQPPKRVAPAMIPPREYLFVVDVSGSMGGFPIQTAKALMSNLLGRLRSEDRFNVLTFAGGSQVMAEASVPATPANVKRARRIIDGIEGSGSTEILGALKHALSMPRSADMSATMVVITDGYVSVEDGAFELVREGLSDANLFAFGIGSSVNRHLIEGLAQAGRGQPFVVENGGAAREAAERFAEYIESPVLTDVKIELDGFDGYDLEPAKVPDLFGERPLIVMGKFRGEPKGAIRIRGTNGQGAFSTALQAEAFHPSDDLAALEYLWARDRIASATQDHDEAKVTALGLEHHLMTEFTSFVAVDTVVRNTDGKRTTVRQPLPMPQGVENGAIAGLMGQSVGGTFGIGGLGTTGSGRGGGGYGNIDLGGRGKGTTRILPGNSVVQGSLAKDVIGRAIRSRLARVKYCYEKRLNTHPGLSGKIVVRFTIAPDGTVSKVEMTSTTMNDPEVEACVLQVMQSLRFPKPSGGGTVIVTYPFNFSPG